MTMSPRQSDAQATASDTAEPDLAEIPAYVPPVPPLADTDEAVRAILPMIDADDTPVAADTERACGYRYYQKAYLIQLKTADGGIHLIDPVAVSPTAFADLDARLHGRLWILHAASQDLPSLREAGFTPQHLFDTELAARLLGRPHVGLGALIEDVLGVRLAKDHGNSDWSQRPLPQSWLSYAAGDVEFLIELAAALRRELVEAGKLEWAEQEFDHVIHQPPAEPKAHPWRSLTDLRSVHSRRGLAVAKGLWRIRERLAQEADLSPHRIINDRAITAVAARVTESSVAAAKLTGRDWRREVIGADVLQFRAAIDEVGTMDESDLPPWRPPRHGPPSPGLWERRQPAA
ncbi:MAG: HRDC domain-containing protein, partial [Propionibacteriaceae bacterium]|nr:HRDC domain-containing protein [Propionibacteriaceae bacterium]